MSSRIASHLRSNVVAYAALFVALSGTAYAANTVGSADIIDNSVASVDLKNSDVRGADVRDGTLGSLDVADESLQARDVADQSLTGLDIRDDSIGGAEIRESFVPSQSTFSSYEPAQGIGLISEYQQLIWTGDDGNGGESGGAYIRLDVPGRVFATANLYFSKSLSEPRGTAVCHLGLIQNGVTVRDIGPVTLESYGDVHTNAVLPLSAGTNVAPGNYAANVRCAGGPLTFRSGTLLFWALPG